MYRVVAAIIEKVEIVFVSQIFFRYSDYRKEIKFW